MTPYRLLKIGSTLYGPTWQSHLARAIGVSPRTMRHWIAGKHPMPAGAWDDIFALAAKRRDALTALITARDHSMDTAAGSAPRE